MEEAKRGDTVRVHYRLKLDDADEYESTFGEVPIEFKLGAGEVIEGFEDAVTGMKPGEEKTVDIPTDKAYGRRREDLVFEVDTKDFPVDLKPEIGKRLQIQHSEGQAATVTVTDVSESNVTLDANHPLAGKDLTFDIELVDIV
jgi:FKBP-type peptidyl-prolyl cis-trans isomerase 2